ncbi:MAG TPA: hypothetical protein VNK05_03165, partial [Chloroflexota bacterium]|nr:hypothetical protein [Chloroflexota bacterium]
MIARRCRRGRPLPPAATVRPRRLTILLLGLVLLLAPWAAALAVPAPPAAAQGASLPPLPRGWPGTLQLGLFDGVGGAAAMQADTGYGFRYAYLAGGVNTGGGWASWNPDGRFATYWIQDSAAHGIVPVFTYYMLVQSRPGGGNEGDANFANLQNRDTMISYYQDLRLLLQRSGEFPNQTVVVHFEPDFWGFMEQRASGDNAATIPAQVAATGLPELAGLPNTVAGFAQAAARLRDAYAPNVVLAYHQSIWGTGNDIQYSNPPDAVVDSLASRAGNFYNSLGAGFDVIFNDFSDRDAGFKQYVYGDGGASFWDAGDFARHVRFLSRLVGVTGKRVALWQIPFGNTKMRAMNNTWNHYQDNRVEWLLDDPGRGHLNAYLQAGAVGFLFGRGADGTTCPCDANNDGVTNPAPINGNTATSLSADDDGGYFRQQARAYYTAGALALPGGGAAPPTPTGVPSATATAGAATPSATAAAPSATPGGAPGFTAAATVGPG